MAIQFPVEYPMNNRLIDSALTLLREVRFHDLWWRHSIINNTLVIRWSDKGSIIERSLPMTEVMKLTPEKLCDLVAGIIDGKPKEEEVKEELGKWGVNDAG